MCSFNLPDEHENGLIQSRIGLKHFLKRGVKWNLRTISRPAEAETFELVPALEGRTVAVSSQPCSVIGRPVLNVCYLSHSKADEHLQFHPALYNLMNL